MRPKRFVITDRSWEIIEPLLPGTTRSRGVTAADNRLFLEAVLWKVRVGGPWRATFQRALLPGIVFLGVSDVGHRRVFFSRYLNLLPGIPTLNTF